MNNGPVNKYTDRASDFRVIRQTACDTQKNAANKHKAMSKTLIQKAKRPSRISKTMNNGPVTDNEVY